MFHFLSYYCSLYVWSLLHVNILHYLGTSCLPIFSKSVVSAYAKRSLQCHCRALSVSNISAHNQILTFDFKQIVNTRKGSLAQYCRTDPIGRRITLTHTKPRPIRGLVGVPAHITFICALAVYRICILSPRATHWNSQSTRPGYQITLRRIFCVTFFTSGLPI